MATAPGTILPFDQLKAQILNNARQFTVCEGYWEAMPANDYQSLIDAGLPYLVGAYKSLPQIVSDAILAQIDEALLNQNGIYTTSATVTNPGVEVFIFGTADVTIIIDNSSRNNINVLGTGTANVTLSNNSWSEIRTFQTATADVVINDTSAACVQTRQSSNMNLTMNDSASSDITAMGDSRMIVVANNSTYALIRGFGHALISSSGAGAVNQTLYELSKNPTIAV